MNYRHLSYMYRPIMIGAGLLVSGGLIAGLANANIYPNNHEQPVIKAKKLDANNDGLISLNELISCQRRSLEKRDRNDDSQIDEAKFNARLVAMFKLTDSNSDGMLDDHEISKLKHRHHDKGYASNGLCEK